MPDYRVYYQTQMSGRAAVDHFTWYFGFVIAGVWWSTDLSHKSSPTKTWCMSCKAYLYALQIGPVHFPSSGEMRTAEQLKEEYNHRDLQCNLLFFLGHFVSNCSSFVPAVAFLKKYQIWDTLLGVFKQNGPGGKASSLHGSTPSSSTSNLSQKSALCGADNSFQNRISNKSAIADIQCD